MPRPDDASSDRVRPSVVAFDVNETLLDLGPVRAALIELGPLVERSLSSESIRAWKPSPQAYLWTAGVCDVAPEQLALVAADGWDIQGAQRAGLTGAWFPRAERRYPAVYDVPHVQAPDLAGTVDALLALPRAEMATSGS